jgi:hypothetical protein
MRNRKSSVTREAELVNALNAIWNTADDALTDAREGRTSFVGLINTLKYIAEDAALALADVPWACEVTEDVTA